MMEKFKYELIGLLVGCVLSAGVVLWPVIESGITALVPAEIPQRRTDNSCKYGAYSDTSASKTARTPVCYLPPRDAERLTSTHCEETFLKTHDKLDADAIAYCKKHPGYYQPSRFTMHPTKEEFY